MTAATDRAWCLQHFSMMAEAGIWMVPRSGLIFTRRGETLALTQRMPFTPELAAAALDGMDVPPTPGALRTYQDADYALIAARFATAGVTVVDEATP